MSKQRLAPGGGGCWIGGPKTASTANFDKGAPRSYGTAEWVKDKGIEGNAGE